MSRYANGTSVPCERSEMEIKRTVLRYKAEQYLSGQKDGQVLVGFKMAGRVLRFTVPMPRATDPEITHFKNGYGYQTKRSETAIAAKLNQEQRQRWRALALSIKAKLEAVESGIEEFEVAFMAQIVVPGTGKTVAELMVPRIDEAYRTGKAPALGWEG